MSENIATSRTNREFLKSLKTPVARFYLCDLHVHSLGSYDVCQANRFERLPDNLRKMLTASSVAGLPPLPLTKEPPDVALYDEKMARPEFVEAYFQSLSVRHKEVAKSEGISDSDNWGIVGITDHNTAHFSSALSKFAWDRRSSDRLIILPGVELELSFPVTQAEQHCPIHVLCLFSPCTSVSQILLAINDSRSHGTGNWTFGSPIAVNDLAEFIQKLRTHVSYPAICIAAHVWSKKGIENEPKKYFLASCEAAIARLEGELQRADNENSAIDESELGKQLKILTERYGDKEGLHLDVLKLIGRCGFDALQIRDQTHETHYRRLHRFRDEIGRATPIICSDAHTPRDVFVCESGIPFVKMSAAVLSAGRPKEVFDELRSRVIRFGETRTTYATPGTVTHWIEGIEIVPDAHDARRFWGMEAHGNVPASKDDGFALGLSRNLNCFVGGRGSGKSAGVEAIAFLTEPDTFEKEARRNLKKK